MANPWAGGRPTRWPDRSRPAISSVTEARLILAQALWEAPVGEGRDRARALTLLEQAREALRGAGEGSAEPLARVEQWLAEHVPARSR